MTTTSTPNRLTKEKSPYLLQHANNPVDWFPWGEEAFDKAKADNKPIFLLLGILSKHGYNYLSLVAFQLLEPNWKKRTGSA